MKFQNLAASRINQMIEILAGPHAIERGARRLSDGLLVAFPTETVYGLGADALCPQAVNKVFALKGRPANNPLIVHVSGIEMAKSVVAHWPKEAQRIAEEHWPGPVTLVLPKADHVPSIVCANGSTLAVRCPAHPCALALIETFGKPIVGPSANPSGRISPTTPEHVQDGFTPSRKGTSSDQEPAHDSPIDLLIIDGGHCRAGIESTVIDLSADTIKVLRPGIIGAHVIAQTIEQQVECVTSSNQDPIAKSPGLLGAHYQPLTPAKLVQSDQLASANPQTTLIAWSIKSHPALGTLIQIPKQLDQYASNIYRALHQADASNADSIWIEHPPMPTSDNEHAIHAAVLERLSRATHL